MKDGQRHFGLSHGCTGCPLSGILHSGCPALESPNPINWLKPKEPKLDDKKNLPVDEKKPIQ